MITRTVGTVGRLVLESRGFHVIEAATGNEGLQKALTERPSVVLLDIVLPGIDGWEIARRIRADASTCKHDHHRRDGARRHRRSSSLVHGGVRQRPYETRTSRRRCSR
jgi:CheY-like chemotaxis protein